MTDTLHRIVYESTVDDALDVAWRFSSRTRAFQNQVRQNVVIAGAVGGLAAIAAFVFAGAVLFPWRISTGVLDNAHDIEMNFAPGICVIRNAHFASQADRQAFLETARRLSANAATATSPTTVP